MAKRKKSDKSLGRDPFEDMNGLGWGEDELFPGPGQEEAEPAPGETDLKSEGPEQAAAEVEPPTEEEEAEATPDETETELVLSEAEELVLSKVEGQPETEPVEAAADAEAEKVESMAEEEAVEAAGAEVEEVEPPAEGEAVSAPSAPPRSRVLDELVATIDEEVKEAFGPGAMTDLATAEPTDQGEGEEQYVIFNLAGSEYAVPADSVREIGEPPNVTPVPNVPDWVLGVANLRGDVLSLVDLRLFLGMERADYDEDTRMMVVHAEQETLSLTTGLMVDLVSDIRYLAVGRIGTPAAPIEDQVAPYLRGVYEHDDHLLVVLNLDQLLLSPEMRQFEPV